MMRLFALLLFTVSSMVGAVVIRDDIDDSKYRAGDFEYPMLVDIPGEGQGVLIAPQWVVTAAHAVTWQSHFSEVSIGGECMIVERVVLHPGYKKLQQEMIQQALDTDNSDQIMAFLETSDDIALLKLALPVIDVTPAIIYRNSDELGKVVKILGKGATGTGALGHDPQGPNRTALRFAFNEINEAQGRWLGYVFDKPPVALPLEGVSSNGDSGGPLLIQVGDQWQVVGLTSWKLVEGDPSTYRPGVYGQVSKNVRLSHYIEWIEGVIAGVEVSD